MKTKGHKIIKFIQNDKAIKIRIEKKRGLNVN